MSNTVHLPHWDLSDLYSGLDDPKIQSDLNKLQESAEAFVKKEALLKQNPANIDDWISALDQYTKLTEISFRLQSFARMVGDEDTSHEPALALQQLLEEKTSHIEASLAFFTNLIIALSDEDAQKLSSHPQAADKYQEFLRNTRRLKPHIKPESEEKLLIQTLYRERQAWTHFENKLSTRIPYGELNVRGKTIKLSESTINKLLEDQDAEVRANAYQKRCQGFEQEYENLSFIYINQNRNLRSEAKIRSYPNTLAYISDRDDVPENLIPNLFESAKKYKSIFTDFYKWKAKQLNVDILAASDVIAPLPSNDDKEITWDQAQETILAAFSELSDGYADQAKTFFDKNWIHAEPLDRKNTGAYCMPTPEHPYLLTNYQDNLTSVNTLAHELGHGIHGLSAKNQSILQQHAGYIACETASQFAEVLLINHLQKQDPELYKSELARFLSRAMNAIFQQTLYTQFEYDAYARAEKESLTPSWLAENWLKLRQELGENSITFQDAEQWNWARISHMFFRPFYCYSYAVSLLVVLSLAQKHNTNKEEFAKRFQNFLSAGGSLSDQALLKTHFGLDLADPSVLDRGFEILKGYCLNLD